MRLPHDSEMVQDENFAFLDRFHPFLGVEEPTGVGAARVALGVALIYRLVCDPDPVI